MRSRSGENPPSSDGSFGPAERLWLAAAVLLAALLRLWGWSEVGIDHFDEGVYAFTGLGWSDASQPLGAYPDQLLFAPPLYPFLVSVAFRLLGASAGSAVMVNVVLGVATVVVVGLVGARWFGARAGVAAAILVAVDPLHVMLSRSALTDVAFLLFFLLALAAAVEAFHAGAWRWAVAAGLLTGLAWNTKYHGWFVLLIVGWGVLGQVWQARGDRSAQARSALLWLTMAAVAALCYLPWALHVHGEMGYGSFLAYQGSNVSGTWVANLARQVGQQGFIESPWSRMGPAAAAVALVSMRPPLGAHGRALTMVVSLTAVGLLVGQGAATLVLLLVALAVWMRPGADVPVWVLAGWTVLWLASAPLYDPYARLLLPLWTAAALGAGWVLARQLGAEPSSAPERAGAATRAGRDLTIWMAAGVLAIGAGLAAWREHRRPQGLWRPADAMERAAVALTETIPVGARVVVLGEPALAFYLHRLGRPAFERTDSPEQVAAIDRSVFMVSGRYVHSAAFLRERILGDLAPRLDELDTVQVVPRDLRVLDDLEPAAAASYLARPDSQFELVLYRLRPAPAP